MIFLKIGDRDITDYCDYQNIEMRKERLYNNWTDANGVEHRVFYRTRISGTADVGFKSSLTFSAFTELMNEERNSEGYYSVTAYVQNTGTIETFDAYIETDGSAKWDFLNDRQWHEVELTIMER